jgi:hypothetical protein
MHSAQTMPPVPPLLLRLPLLPGALPQRLLLLLPPFGICSHNTSGRIAQAGQCKQWALRTGQYKSDRLVGVSHQLTIAHSYRKAELKKFEWSGFGLI